MLGNIGSVELLLIMVVILLVFGAKRIPEIARGLGKGITEFKQAAREIQSEFTDVTRSVRLDEDRTRNRGATVDFRAPDAAPSAEASVRPRVDVPGAPSAEARPRGTDQTDVQSSGADRGETRRSATDDREIRIDPNPAA